MKAHVEYRRPTKLRASIENDAVKHRTGTMLYAIWRTGIHLMNSSDRVNMG